MLEIVSANPIVDPSTTPMVYGLLYGPGGPTCGDINQSDACFHGIRIDADNLSRFR